MSLYDGKTLETDYRQLVADNLAKLEKQSRETREPTIERFLILSYPGAPIPVVVRIDELEPETGTKVQRRKDGTLKQVGRPISRYRDRAYRKAIEQARELEAKRNRENQLGGK